MKIPQNILKWLFCTAVPKILIFLLALPFVILIRILRPIVWLRFVPVSERIGHGLANIDVYLLEHRAGIDPAKTLDIFYPDRPWKCNRQMIKMWKRLLPLYDFVYWIVWANWGNPLMTPHYYSPSSEDWDVHGLSNNTPPPVAFTTQEEDKGTALLRAMGIPPGSSIVCFHARDNSFLKTLNPTVNWGYHDYRDVNIDTYVPAVKELVARGYYAIRMGRVVNSAFPWKDPHVIDYATSSWRSDFADMYLISRSQFYIGSSAGLDMVALLFRKQWAVVNMIPMGLVFTSSPSYLHIFKKLWLIKEKRFLRFNEVINSDVGMYWETAQYKNHGLEIINNTPQEVSDLIIEKEERLRGSWQTNNEYEELQRRFWKLFPRGKKHQVFNSRIGSKFLLQNRDLLD